MPVDLCDRTEEFYRRFVQDYRKQHSHYLNELVDFYVAASLWDGSNGELFIEFLMRHFDLHANGAILNHIARLVKIHANDSQSIQLKLRGLLAVSKQKAEAEDSDKKLSIISELESLLGTTH